MTKFRQEWKAVNDTKMQKGSKWCGWRCFEPFLMENRLNQIQEKGLYSTTTAVPEAVTISILLPVPRTS